VAQFKFGSCAKSWLITAILVMIAIISASIPSFAASTIKNPTTPTLDIVKKNGFVRCGVTERMPGFSTQSADGSWVGFNADFCRAIAAATLGDKKAVQIADYWLDALIGKSIDVSLAGSTWTFSRDVNKKIDFPSIYFYDGQGFISHAAAGVKTLNEAKKKKGLRVCAIMQTSTAALNLQDFIKKSNVEWTVVGVLTMDGMWRAFFGGRCDMAIHDRTALAGVLAGRLKGSQDFVVFPEVISKEPLAPAVRQDDPKWHDLITWVINVTIAAEELGITQANVDDMKAHSKLPNVQRLLGRETGFGKGFGLDEEWAYRIIKSVGNYGEIFDRNLGTGSDLKMSRGINNLWTSGGLLYAPPVR